MWAIPRGWTASCASPQWTDYKRFRSTLSVQHAGRAAYQGRAKILHHDHGAVAKPLGPIQSPYWRGRLSPYQAHAIPASQREAVERAAISTLVPIGTESGA